ncbi:fatty-acid amide hydrolase 2, partial [Trichonephila clavata]
GESSLLTAAASVIGIGTDLGGSIRIPALFSGIFGHKPSAGAVSNGNQYPVVNEAVRQLISTGPMCRYAMDLLPMMKIISGDMRQPLRLDEPVCLHSDNEDTQTPIIHASVFDGRLVF